MRDFSCCSIKNGKKLKKKFSMGKGKDRKNTENE